MRNNDILEFQGEHRWLSNFWRVKIEYETFVFPSNEHFYQAMKFPDVYWEFFTKCENPKKEARNHSDLFNKRTWIFYRVGVMITGLRIKFQDPVLRQKLIDTGDVELVEGNYWHDNFWGNCTCEKCKDIPGANILGEHLMLIREEIKNG